MHAHGSKTKTRRDALVATGATLSGFFLAAHLARRGASRVESVPHTTTDRTSVDVTAEEAMTVELARHQMTPAFTTRSLRPGVVAMGHVLNVDHFVMSQPTFPPHPHAGFSAVTWMLPWSDGGFINRDSRGDRSRIGPGTLHWTLAGGGTIHEEIPEEPGVACEGLQIFVKLPEDVETMPPAAFHVDAESVPVVSLVGGRARVLVGAFEGTRAQIPSYGGVTMLHVDVDEGEVAAGSRELVLPIPTGVEAFVVVLRGTGTVDGTPVSVGVASTIAAPSVRLMGKDLHALVAWSEPMRGQPTFQGPFCMFRRERLADAREAYTSGRLGSLAPSNVRFVR